MFTRNLRLMMAVAAILMSAMIGTREGAGQQPFQSDDLAVLARDDFNGKLSLHWDVRRADPSRVSFTKRPGFLTITTQEGDIFGPNRSAKNLYLTRVPQPLEGIQITTCIDAFAPQSNSNQAGLLCFNDDDNYVKFTVENNPDGGRRLIMIGEVSGRAIIERVADPAPGAQRLWLRITKQRENYTFSASADGVRFQECGTEPWGVNDSLKAPRWIGLLAINGLHRESAPNIDASFDFFEVRRFETTQHFPGRLAWTLDEALDHLRLYPRDVYMKYVALQLARNDGRLQEVTSTIQRVTPWQNRFAARREQVDLFSIFTGQLAIQESLQLDAMAAEDPTTEQTRVGRPVAAGRTGPPLIGQPDGREPGLTSTVAISELEGPTIKSHPWHEMLADRSPAVTGLALNVPSDFYFVSFRSMNKLLDATQLATQWGAHIFNQANREAQTQLVGQRLQEQLAVEENPELRPFYDTVVDEVALVGSDLFLREGSDVTLLFQVKQPVVFRLKMDQFLSNAEDSNQDASRTEGEYLGIEYVHVATPDRQIHVYSAYPTPELHVRSNSLSGLERVLEAVVGHAKNGEPVERLGETEEFRYVRTLMPQGAAEEDGFVYLSDPFMRQLMRPALRLTERRRMVCYNDLRMIGHASLMYRTQTGKVAESLEDLVAANCVPGKFGQGKLACPDHGTYSLGSDGLTGVCSVHGYASYLTPCSELELTNVSQAEAQAYRQFVTEYSSYWRLYFDPIVIRLQITPERYRAETLVLPLIDNTVYATLARSLGGEPEALDALPVPKRNIFTFAVRLNKAKILQQMGMQGLLEDDQIKGADQQAIAETRRMMDSFGKLWLAVHNYNDKNKHFPQAALVDSNGRALLSWRVQLLPFLDEQDLYEQFRLDEPWDSPHNRKLIAKMPEIFCPANEKLSNEGKTKIVAPRGEDTVFPSDNRQIGFEDIRDGTWQTVMLLEADDEHAVVWTKPQDLNIDSSDPLHGLAIHSPMEVFLTATCGGRVQHIDRRIGQAELAALLTRAGGERLAWQQFDRTPRQRHGPFGYLPEELVNELRLGELLTKGVGNQIGFHVYDSEPMFDLSLARFMGMWLSSFRGGRSIDDDFLFIFPLVGALNGPVYVSIPVQNREIVDGFLNRLDDYLAELARRPRWGWFFSVNQDFYHLSNESGQSDRAHSIECGPLKWRFFWNRIGDAVYIASKQEVLDDLAALESGGAGKTDPAADVAHALVRLRPQNWDRVLRTYQLGWEENHREACLNNLGPLSSLSRAISSSRAPGDQIPDRELDQYAGRVYDAHHFCPDEGAYVVSPDGRTVACSTHGTALKPRQSEAPAEASGLGQQLRQFRDLNIKFTFLEDGLRAVVTLERQEEPASRIIPER